MLHDRMRPLFRMCAIIAASHLHNSCFLLSPRLRSHSDPITPINTYSILIQYVLCWRISMWMQRKNGNSEWACSNFLLNWSHLRLWYGRSSWTGERHLHNVEMASDQYCWRRRLSRWTRAVERWLNGGTSPDKEWKSSTVVFTPLDWSSTPFSRWQMWLQLKVVGLPLWQVVTVGVVEQRVADIPSARTHTGPQ